MVYLYKKSINGKHYYYLREGFVKDGKTITKDIMYIGHDLSQVTAKLRELPSEYADDIAKSSDRIHRFLVAEHYLSKVNSDLQRVEACALHWRAQGQKGKLKVFLPYFLREQTGFSLQQVSQLLGKGLTPQGKPFEDVQRALSIEKVFFELLGRSDLSVDLIMAMSSHLGMSVDRHYVVELLDWYASLDMYPFSKACLFYQRSLKDLGILSGLLMNFILINSSYPPVIGRKMRLTKQVVSQFENQLWKWYWKIFL